MVEKNDAAYRYVQTANRKKAGRENRERLLEQEHNWTVIRVAIPQYFGSWSLGLLIGVMLYDDWTNAFTLFQATLIGFLFGYFLIGHFWGYLIRRPKKWLEASAKKYSQWSRPWEYHD